jgi:hypothetical protein
MDVVSPDGFAEFAKSNPVAVEKKDNRLFIIRTSKS